MKIVFFGTPEYVVPIVNSLHKAFFSGPAKSPVAAVVTQKPQPVGRKQILTYSPVDSWAHKHGVPIFFNPKDLIAQNIKADLGVLAAYGAIIPSEVIAHFPHGIVNIHPSLLPKYRGASPVQAAIVRGEKETGVTMMKLDEKLDHGEIISQFTEEISRYDTTGLLRERLFTRSTAVLVALIEPYLAGKITPKKQDESEATITRQITKENGFIPPQAVSDALEGKEHKEKLAVPFIQNYSLIPNPSSLDRLIRALSPWPGAWTMVKLDPSGQARRLKILKAHLAADKLVPDEVQLEGKNPVPWEEFKRGYPKAELLKV